MSAYPLTEWAPGIGVSVQKHRLVCCCALLSRKDPCWCCSGLSFLGRMCQERVGLQNIRACRIIDLLPAIKLAAVALKPGLLLRFFLHFLYVRLCRKRTRAVSRARVAERCSYNWAEAAVLYCAARMARSLRCYGRLKSRCAGHAQAPQGSSACCEPKPPVTARARHSFSNPSARDALISSNSSRLFCQWRNRPTAQSINTLAGLSL